MGGWPLCGDGCCGKVPIVVSWPLGEVAMVVRWLLQGGKHCEEVVFHSTTDAVWPTVSLKTNPFTPFRSIHFKVLDQSYQIIKN